MKVFIGLNMIYYPNFSIVSCLHLGFFEKVRQINNEKGNDKSRSKLFTKKKKTYPHEAYLHLCSKSFIYLFINILGNRLLTFYYESKLTFFHLIRSKTLYIYTMKQSTRRRRCLFWPANCFDIQNSLTKWLKWVVARRAGRQSAITSGTKSFTGYACGVLFV